MKQSIRKVARRILDPPDDYRAILLIWAKTLFNSQNIRRVKIFVFLHDLDMKVCAVGGFAGNLADSAYGRAGGNVLTDPDGGILVESPVIDHQTRT